MLINPETLFANSEKREDAAKQILEAYNQSGHPFALFLSRWESISIQFGDEMRHFQGDESQALESLPDKISRYLLELEFPMILVQNQAYVDSMVSWTPALRLGDDVWEEEIRSLVEMADLIFFQMLWSRGEGMDLELEIIRAERKESCTIILIPASKQLEVIEHFSPIKKDADFLVGFPRVAYTDELDLSGLLAMPLTVDILLRMISIRQVPLSQRRELCDSAKRRLLFPLPKEMGEASMGEQVISLALSHERANDLENVIGTLQVGRQYFTNSGEDTIVRLIDIELARLSTESDDDR